MTGLTRYRLWYGRDEPPPELHLVRAGPVSALLDGIDLRYVRIGPVELVRRVYVAVRDTSWGTLANEVVSHRLEAGGDRFLLDFEVANHRGEIDFTWRGRIEGRPDGTVSYELDGVASRAFDYNRLGICVLHPPAESAGRPYRATTEAGIVEGVLPDLIAPQEIVDGKLRGVFPPFSELAVSLAPGGEARFAFEGDLFEMEDQRNWADASFKTYSTPLALGFPHRAEAGARIRQRLAVTAPGVPAGREPEERVTLSLGPRVGPSLPEIGVGIAGDRGALTGREAALLRELAFAHVRADLDLADPGHPAELERALETCEELGAGLELALLLDDGSGPVLDALAGRLAGAPLARVLAFARDQRTGTPTETTPPGLMRLARERLRPALPGVPVGGGTDMYFTELNRTRPDVSLMDVVAFSTNPQVHAFDDLSLVETLEAQGDTVRSARALADGKPVVVTPVALRYRWPVHGPIQTAPGELPFQVDARQLSLMLAGWTVGSVKYTAEAGAASLTYYETTGWRGLVETERGSPLPERFPSEPGMVFPVYWAFRELARLRGGAIVACSSTAPLRAIGLALASGDGLTVLVANLTPAETRVTLTGLRGEATVRAVVDEATAETAMHRPAAHAPPAAPLTVTGGAAELELGPFALVAVQAEAP